MSGDQARSPRSLARLAGLLLAAALVTAGFAGLGIWQVQRRVWKLDLIARVDARLHAAPVPAPGPAEWPGITRDKDEYRRVSLSGHYLPGHDSYTMAATVFGSGYWVLSPFAERRGFTVLVNRGFVPPERRGHVPPDPATAVAGLLRITEPRGGFLRSNDPAAGRWYSRDVAAIAAREHLVRTAPYFVDAGPSAMPAMPVGGLTVVRFPNSHLVYAITWFGLMLLTLVGAGLLVREEARRRR